MTTSPDGGPAMTDEELHAEAEDIILSYGLFVTGAVAPHRDTEGSIEAIIELVERRSTQAYETAQRIYREAQR